IVCAISLSLTLKSRYSSQPSAYFHRRLFTIEPRRRRSVPLLRPATSPSLTYSSVLFFVRALKINQNFTRGLITLCHLQW
ncbi:hypothetical protein LINPERHAP1_LOCUS39763, partial [Linum perenne]